MKDPSKYRAASFVCGVLVGLSAVGCVTPSQPTDEEMAPPALAEEEVTPQLAEEEARPPQSAEEDVAPQPTEKVVFKFDPLDLPKYDWAISPEGIDFLEAVFRYKLESNLDADFVALGLNGPEGGVLDLPPALLSRLADYPNITLASETYIPNWGRDSVRHGRFGGRGRAFIIEDLHVIDQSTIKVEVRSQGGCKSVSSYRFERRDGQWVMAEVLWSWIT